MECDRYDFYIGEEHISGNEYYVELLRDVEDYEKKNNVVLVREKEEVSVILNKRYKSVYYSEVNKDNVNKPHHYVGDNGLEVEQVLQEFLPRYENAYVAHRIASAVEYVLRSPLKNGIEDLKKARKNLDQAIEYLEND